MPDYGPHFTKEKTVAVSSIDYLDWYIPRLAENRENNLSFSGMKYQWDIPELLGESINDIAKWHMEEITDPREIIADRENVNPENVLICHGATQGLNIALLTLISQLKLDNNSSITVAVESPTYAPISQSALLLADEVIRIERIPPTNGYGFWRIDRNSWKEAMINSQILMITPVSNPSGWNLHPEDRSWIFEQSEDLNVKIIADEVYLDAFRNSSDYYPTHNNGEGHISINSLTKIYSLGEIRFGWIISDKSTIETARRIFMTFSGVMGAPTMRIGTAALQSLEKVETAMELYRHENLPLLRNVLQKFNINWNEPEFGVFGTFQLPKNISGEEFVDGPCKDNELLIIPCSMFSNKLSNWVRIAWSIEPKMFKKAISALEKSLQSLID